MQCNVLTESEIGNLELGSTITTVSSADISGGSSSSFQVSLSAEVIMPPYSTTGSVWFSKSLHQISESRGSITLTIETNPSITLTTVEIQTADSRGTARAGTDYTPISSKLVEIGPSQTSKSFSVSILPDEEEEYDETFVVAIVSSTSGAISEPRETTITIVDDDESAKSGCSIGHEVVDRTADFSHHKLVAVLQDNAVPCKGLVTKWEFWPHKSASFKAVVFRQTESANTAMWKIIGVNDIPVSSVVANKIKKNTYIVPAGDRIEVKRGDVIGIAQYDDNPLLASDLSETGTTLYVAYSTETSEILSESEITDLKPGSIIKTVTIETLGGAGPLLVSFSAEVEPESQGNGAAHLYQSWMTMAIFFASVSTLIYLY
ncbi:uncharacterized protein [Amphiura filiformis]|uniref:uncharacterized protein n=1 Tax=Amphiura filiformis TaxID=82378 RepID=UPI003B219D79